MNERIKQLAEQAGIEFTYDPTEVPMRAFVEAWEEDLEKFAMLIIKRCRNIVSDTRDLAIEEEWNVDESMSTAMYDIEEHFGVE